MVGMNCDLIYLLDSCAMHYENRIVLMSSSRDRGCEATYLEESGDQWNRVVRE